MRQKGIKLTVPEPCHEKWAEMSESEKGRFCMSCQKDVVDFTTYTDEQVLDYFSHASGKQCGRFYKTQLQRTIVPVRTVERPSILQFFLGSVLALFSSKTVFAQGMPISDTIIISKTEALKEALESKTIAKKSQPLTIEGLVVDSVTGEPIIGVSVTIQGTYIGCSSDFDGKFKLIIPDEYSGKEITVRFASIGYESKSLSLARVSSPQKIELFVDMDGTHCVVMGASIEVIRPEQIDNMETFRVKQWLKSIGHW